MQSAVGSSMKNVPQKDRDDLKALLPRLDEENLAVIDVYRSNYFHANNNPTEFSYRVESIKHYSKALKDLKNARKSFAKIPRKFDYNTTGKLLGLRREFTSMLLKPAYEDGDDYHTDHLKVIDECINRIETVEAKLHSLKNRPKGPNQLNEIDQFLKGIFGVYSRIGGTQIINFNHETESYYGTLLEFTKHCFSGLPEEFIPKDESLANRMRRVTSNRNM